MQFLITAIVAAAIMVTSLSFYAIRYASRRPANGELKTISRIESKIEHNTNRYENLKDEVGQYSS